MEFALCAAIEHGRQQRYPENGKGPNGGQKRKCGRRNRQPVGAERRIGNERDGAHGREMMRDDCNRQQARGDHGMNGIVTARGDEHCKGREYASEDDRGRNDAGCPHNVGRKLEREHAGVVHRRHAGADDCTADRNDRPARTEQCNAKPDGDNGHGEEQGQQRDGYIVPGACAGIVSQHCNEMGGPDSATADSRVEADPDRARSAMRGPRTMKQADGDRAGERADGSCQQNQTPVMLGDEAS